MPLQETPHIKRNVFLLCLLWTGLLAASLVWNIRDQRQESISSAHLQAEISTSKDISFRSWATSHGGVYVRPTEKSPPNPYLKVPDRDVVTTDGTRLTLINPAYMMRQLYQDFSGQYGMNGHLTSLKLVNPNNAPDAWEREALLAFERGAKEKSEVMVASDGKRIFRYMRPFYIEQGCLKCHGGLGYKVGDVRGGVSTIVNMDKLDDVAMISIHGLQITYGVVWLVGLAGIFVSGRHSMLRSAERERNIRASHLNEQRALTMLALDRKADELDEKAFIQLSLEEAERLTSSQISFLHFINDDQQTIRLVAWSRHTMEHCNALSDSHYPLADAGIWADCVRLGKPVIHNDFQSIGYKRGYPQGHVGLERYLSVPVLEGDQVRLIMAAGNKAGEYDEDDVRLLQMIANDLWKVVRRRHAEEALRTYASQLETANRDMENFNYSVSHVMRTPLRAINGFSKILLEDYAARLDDEGKRLLHVVMDNSQNMGQLIDDILAYSHTALLEVAYSEIDMDELVSEVMEELKPSFAGRELKLELGALPPAYADRNMLRQVLLNLLDNAIKYTRNKVAALVEVGALGEDNENVYYVKDNGAGFDMQYAGKLFGVFHRLHGIGEFEGSGIGLAIVKRIITKHGGRVWAEGKVGEGATVYFSLPRA